MSPTPAHRDGISLLDYGSIMLLPRASTPADHRSSAPSFWVIFVPVILGILVILACVLAYWFFRKRNRQDIPGGLSNLPPQPSSSYPPQPPLPGAGLGPQRESWDLQSNTGTFGGRYPRVDPFPAPAPPPAAFRSGSTPASVSGSGSGGGSARGSNSHHSQSPPRSAASAYSPTTPSASVAGALGFRGPLSPEPTGNAPAYRTTTPTAASVLADDEVEQSIFDQQRRSMMTSAAGSAPGAPGYNPSMMYNPTASSGPTRPNSPGSPQHAYRSFPDPYAPRLPPRPQYDEEDDEKEPTLAQRAHEFI